MKKDNLFRIPPLPSILDPPLLGADPHQKNVEKILGKDCVPIQGYFAASVDIGRVKLEIEKALKSFSMKQVKERWSEDVFEWIRAFTQKWIQRRKHLRAKPLKNGIHLYIQTQDDEGYYEYEFDIFASKN